MTASLTHVDVFSAAPLAGNPLPVVVSADALPEEQMTRLAIEMRQFETVFLHDVDERECVAAARIFTPHGELPFAGHPLIGAAAVLHAGRGEASTGEWTLRLGDRRVRLRCDGADWPITVEMNQGPGSVGATLGDELTLALLHAVGLLPEDRHGHLPAQVISTGLPLILLPLRQGLERASIDTTGLDPILAATATSFVYLLDPETLEGRSWDDAGLVEDVATASAAGPIARYLRHHGVVDHDAFVVRQGRHTGRPSEMQVRLDRATEEIWVGGQVSALLEGRLIAAAGRRTD
jgi:PhzF family phenazine biosynthesis protein